MVGIKRKRTSPVWEYFHCNEDEKKAKCNICCKEVLTTQGCTSGLSSHLRNHHQIDVKETFKQKTSTLPISADEAISKMVALDGYAFSTLANSSTMRCMFETTFQSKFPQSSNTIRDTMMRFFEEKKQLVIKEMKQFTTQNKRFCLTLDEWTSGANRRYMAVNVHAGSVFWNLGLIPITGSFTSENCLETTKSKLQEFDLNLIDNICAIGTDGAAVMKRFVLLSGREKQLCMAHGIHLAVVDALYKSTNSTFAQNSIPLGTNAIVEDFAAAEFFDLPFSDENDDIEYLPSINSIITKVRKIAKIFTGSPKKMQILQMYSGGLSIEHDIKTRWNSLLVMLERFIKIRDAIQKALIDVRIRDEEQPNVSDQDFSALQELVKVLRPVRIAAEAICRRDCNLIEADVSLNFMMDKLSDCTCEIGVNLYISMKKRILERRTDLSEVFSYLHYGHDAELPGHRKGIFKKMSRQALTTKIKSLFETYIEDNLDCSLPVESSDSESTEASQSLLIEVSLESELNLAIKQARSYKIGDGPYASTSRQSRDPSSMLTSAVKREMSALEGLGSRGRILQGTLDMLKCVPPSTVEAERVFSAPNNFCRKTRAKLGDKTLNALVFLKYYFKNARD